MARAMSLMVLAILLVVTSGCSYLFYPRAGDYAAQAKGATGVDTMKPFTPNTRQTLKNYYEVPVDIVESADTLVEWARAAANR